MKIWLLALILVAPLAAVSRSAAETDPPDRIDGWEAAAPEDPNTPSTNWVDSSYDYATDQTQALSEWMDSYLEHEAIANAIIAKDQKEARRLLLANIA